jgi:hypothetical protein
MLAHYVCIVMNRPNVDSLNWYASKQRGKVRLRLFAQFVVITFLKHKSSRLPFSQGCQMAYFQTKNTDWGKFWRVLQWKMSVYYVHVVYFTASRYIFVTIWYILWLFCIFITILVKCTKKNLATLLSRRGPSQKNSLTYVCDEKRLNDLNVEKDTFLSIELATHNAWYFLLSKA